MLELTIILWLFAVDYIMHYFSIANQNMVLLFLTYIRIYQYNAFLVSNIYLLIFTDTDYFWRLSKLTQIILMSFIYNTYIGMFIIFIDLLI